MNPRRPRAGVTLLEVVIAVSLLSLLMAGVMTSLRVALNALSKTNTRLISNRRVAGAQQALRQELEGFMPVVAAYAPSPDLPPSAKIPFFQGEPASMRFVSSYSLQEATRGRPRILELQVIPGEGGKGVRLVVNEQPYTGPLSAGLFCLGPSSEGFRFRPIEIGSRSFVLADKLAFCRFSYQVKPLGTTQMSWTQQWIEPYWPAAIRVEMGPLDEDIARLRPLSVSAQIHVNRMPLLDYDDFLQ